MRLLKISTVLLHMFSLVCVFLKITLKSFIKVLFCDSDEKFGKRNTEYQGYLLSKDYKPGKVKKQFSNIKNSLEKRQENQNYKRLLFLFPEMWLHSITLCCLSLKASLDTIYIFHIVTNQYLILFRKIP